MTIYDLVERTQDVADNATSENGFATKDEITSLATAMNGINQIINSIKTDVDTMKSDMYGIAGKKKTVKKSAEVADDE